MSRKWRLVLRSQTAMQQNSPIWRQLVPGIWRVRPSLVFASIQRLEEESGREFPVGQAVCAYPDQMAYVVSVYIKGMVFLDELQQQLGEEEFFKELQANYRMYQFAVADGPGFLEEARWSSGRDLDPL